MGALNIHRGSLCFSTFFFLCLTFISLEAGNVPELLVTGLKTKGGTSHYLMCSITVNNNIFFTIRSYNRKALSGYPNCEKLAQAPKKYLKTEGIELTKPQGWFFAWGFFCCCCCCSVFGFFVFFCFSLHRKS